MSERAADDGFPELGIYTELARVGKALASPVRLRLLDILEEGERTVEDLSAASGFGLKNTSSQLQILRSAQLVTNRRDGVRIHYRIASPQVSAILGTFARFAADNVSAVRAEIDAYFSDHRDLVPVTASDLAAMLDDDSVLIVDVRDREEFERGHIPGAISVPQDQIRELLDTQPADARIIAYCQGPYCLASPAAARALMDADRDATVVEGGLTAWIRSGGALSTS
ncbi:metalloregulator ArsR/SmtB family transcription factor [Gordonia sp. OPL2]|uniref:ArsR/SmtB family transcription factor n=1 Tax=Gordonia sp. OPL2 TaxID=2486274 RepID=UPI00165655F2|nr:metalloregulator ArsR/SmtB family transcription factor [Gordonia sp. OPL2]RPA10188.1 ArsR family transcriptional regulator [Gordonia sp. OPL2]